MKIGFLFPGQGSQSIGMGKDLYEKYSEYREVYKKVDKILNMQIEKITFEGTEEELGRTDNTQIAILTMSLAILAILNKKGIKSKSSAGLSLGEYAALIESNVISFDDGVKIVKRRGELMHNLCPEGNWGMAAILGLDEQSVKESCENVDGIARPVNFNCPGQIVISGEKEAVQEAMKIAQEKGAKRIVTLKTSGPFHTEMLKDASVNLREELEKININDVNSKVVKNIDGKQYAKTDNVKDILAAHIINPVRFEDCIKTMLDNGIDTFVEVGPGKSLSGFVKKINRDVKILNINDVPSLENSLKELEERDR